MKTKIIALFLVLSATMAVADTLCFEITTGIMWTGPVRRFLERCKFEGMKIDWLEQPGWIQTTFVVKGEKKDVQVIAFCLSESMTKANDKAEKILGVKK